MKAIFLPGALVVALLSFVANVAPTAAQEVSDGARSAIEWGRIIGGVVGTVGLLFGVVLYMRAVAKTNSMLALQNTVKIYEGERDALRDREQRVTAELTEAKQRAILSESTIAGLKARTDLTEVIRAQQEFSTSMLRAFQDMQTQGATQYTEAMKLIVDMSKQLADIHAAVVVKGAKAVPEGDHRG